jgi:hypothetical protein
MYLVRSYPQISQTYIKSEIEAIRDEFEVRVNTRQQALYPYKNHVPYSVQTNREKILDAVQEFRPDVLHTHWLRSAKKVAKIASEANIPYTVRAHSFDVLDDPEGRYATTVPLLNDDLCLGVLTFPFGRPILENIGVRGDKIHDCYPVVNFERFFDRSPNGQAVMNVGACLPKKKMTDFLQLAAGASHLDFNLYALGYNRDKIAKLNNEQENPVKIMPQIEPDEMPGEYKKHRWLVYTASREIGTVGWSMAIAEAQASGVGVCMANLRPDLREYVGPAGFLFDSVNEVAEIISKPFPEELREMGFKHSKKSDVFEHKTILTNLWRQAHT